MPQPDDFPQILLIYNIAFHQDHHFLLSCCSNCIFLIILSYRGYKLKSFRIYTLTVHYLWLVLSHCIFLVFLYPLTRNIAMESKYHPTNKCWVLRNLYWLHYPKGHPITPPHLHHRHPFCQNDRESEIPKSWPLGLRCRSLHWHCANWACHFLSLHPHLFPWWLETLRYTSLLHWEQVYFGEWVVI